MNIVKIAPSRAKAAPPKSFVSRYCGPEGCEIDWLASTRHEAELDVVGFTAFAMQRGWGDGLPLVPPTETRVRTFLAANKRYPDEVIAYLPTRAECTIEKIAINAVMAGAPPESLPLLIAAVEAVADPDFELFGVNATTAPVSPALFVNGPIRNTLGIPYQHGCFGGAASAAPAIGASCFVLIIRNVAGQVVGVTSQQHLRCARARDRYRGWRMGGTLALAAVGRATRRFRKCGYGVRWHGHDERPRHDLTKTA